jgi:hypothetical protein
MAHPLYNKQSSLTKYAAPDSAAYTHDENDAYRAYRTHFQSHTTASLLQVAIETEETRAVQVLEGRVWQDNNFRGPETLLHQDTTVLGSLVGLFRKSETHFAPPSRPLDHPHQTSPQFFTQNSIPFTDHQESIQETHSDINSYQQAHDAYLFYANLSQAHTTTNLLQVALATEAERDAQFVEGSHWQEYAPNRSDDCARPADTTVLGSLVNLFGSLRR